MAIFRGKMAIFPRKRPIFPRKSPFSPRERAILPLIAPASRRHISFSYRVFVMPFSLRRRPRTVAFLAPLLLVLAAGPGMAACAGDNGGLVLAEGLCAVVVASDAGPVRQ